MILNKKVSSYKVIYFLRSTTFVLVISPRDIV